EYVQLLLLLAMDVVGSRLAENIQQTSASHAGGDNATRQRDARQQPAKSAGRGGVAALLAKDVLLKGDRVSLCDALGDVGRRHNWLRKMQIEPHVSADGELSILTSAAGNRKGDEGRAVSRQCENVLPLRISRLERAKDGRVGGVLTAIPGVAVGR